MRDNSIPIAGPRFLRIHAEYPNGESDIEFGLMTAKPHPGQGPIRSGMLPAGSYASVTWMGECDKLPDVCAMLVGWAEARNTLLDREVVAEDILYGCRLEIYLRDLPSTDSTHQWEIETGVLLKSA